jgi:hypothetical protein
LIFRTGPGTTAATTGTNSECAKITLLPLGAHAQSLRALPPLSR